MFLNKVFVA